jgi:hypothetical protein
MICNKEHQIIVAMYALRIAVVIRRVLEANADHKPSTSIAALFVALGSRSTADYEPLFTRFHQHRQTSSVTLCALS